MPRPGYRRGGRGTGSRDNLVAQTARLVQQAHATLQALDTTISHGFTLQDEIRHTAAHGSATWSRDSRLRFKPVSFVSTGTIDPLKQSFADENLEDDFIEAKPESLTPSRPDMVGDGSCDEVDEVQNLVSARVSQSDSHDHQLVESSRSSNLTPGVTKIAVGTIFRHDTRHMLGERRIPSGHAVPSPNPSPNAARKEAKPQSSSGSQRSSSISEDDMRGARVGILTNSGYQPDIVSTNAHSPSATIRERGQRGNSEQRIVSRASNLSISQRLVSKPPAVPEASSSDEEIIYFKGRRRHQAEQPSASRVVDRASFDLQNITTELRVMEVTTSTSHRNFAQDASARSGSIQKGKAHFTTFRPPGDGRQAISGRNDDEAILEDYLANMREHGQPDTHPSANFSIRPLAEFSAAIPPAVEATELSRLACSEAEAPQNASGQSDSDMGASETDTRDDREDSDDNVTAPRAATTGPLSMDYDDFDVMDWNRPSLRRKKGAKSQLDVQLSDPELAEIARKAWSNDRQKKAERRREREELRAQGLLGKKVDPTDLRVKYPQGMKLEQVVDELEIFLLGSNSTLSLPPMDNHARKIIHELSNKLKLKSKSTGAGSERRPTLTRTNATPKYSEETFDAAVVRIRRKYFPRTDIQTRGTRARASRAGATAAAAHVHDGEVVGQGAPELGSDNRGRTMLEKMGWTQGMALGSDDNKGILQPVSHVVKRSKAGLG